MIPAPTPRFPWRIEAKRTPFHPYETIVPSVKTLDYAVQLSSQKKRVYRYYAVRIRAN